MVAEYDLLDILFESQTLSPASKRRMETISSELTDIWKKKRLKLDSVLETGIFWKEIVILLIFML
jgi:hypothetical protein